VSKAPPTGYVMHQVAEFLQDYTFIAHNAIYVKKLNK
jgi:DNA polymerase III epsilon subunit-like protein